MCVQVCPTGIDIREGLQYECIACAACIDACDSVMDKFGYPRGLVRYSTERALEHKKYRFVRPRTIVYSAVLTILIVAMVSSIVLRKPVIVITSYSIHYTKLYEHAAQAIHSYCRPSRISMPVGQTCTHR